MTRLPVLLAALALCVSAGATAQMPPPPPSAAPGYQTSGAATGAQANAMMREEMLAFRREINEAKLMYSQNKEMLSQLAAAQVRLYAQLTTISQQHVAKEELLRQSRAEIEGLNQGIQQARALSAQQLDQFTSRMGALEQRLATQEAALVRVESAPRPIAAALPEPPPAVAAGVSRPGTITQQCSDLNRGDVRTWTSVVAQLLPGHTFEEVDRANDRVWARKGSTSQGFVYSDVMAKIGCEA